jgi:hypothetical protein
VLQQTRTNHSHNFVKHRSNEEGAASLTKENVNEKVTGSRTAAFVRRRQLERESVLLVKGQAR